jgi:hypothetical protein
MATLRVAAVAPWNAATVTFTSTLAREKLDPGLQHIELGLFSGLRTSHRSLHELDPGLLHIELVNMNQ